MNGTTDASAAGRARDARTVDRLVDRAVVAMNRGEVDRAHRLARTALAGDTGNRDAAVLLGEDAPSGELRRATLMFTDLVGSTALSERLAPEAYRNVVRRYTALCRRVIEERYEGHVSHVAGDGILAVFGAPVPHENDVERGVRAGIDIVNELVGVSDEVERATGERLQARAGVHRGLVYLDSDADDIYGLAANIASRLQSLAQPGTVVISGEVRDAVGDRFVTEELPPRHVKGVSQPITPHRVVALASTPSRRPEAPLVGRRDERRVLDDAWASVRSARHGPGRGVHLVGEAGIGKSRLCASFLADVAPDVRRTVELRGSPLHAASGFHALRPLLPGGEAGGSPTTLEALTEAVTAAGLDPDPLVALLARLTDLPADAQPTIELDGRLLREAVADAAYRFLAASLGGGAAILVVEDLHWCDPTTVEVVGRMLRDSPDPVLVVTTSREPAPDALQGVQQVAVGPLTRDQSARLVRALAPHVDDEVCAALVTRGDGVPLFVEALVNARSGAPGDATPASGLPGPPRPDASAVPAAPVPDPLYELLVTRLHATPAAAVVGAAAAAVGPAVEPEVLAEVVGLPEAAVTHAVRALADAGVLVVDTEGSRYRFRHELLREVAYELAPPTRRRQLHRRAAAALHASAASGRPVDWRLVADHHERAGELLSAVDALVEAAESARRVGELVESRALLDRAIDLVGRAPEEQPRWRREVGLRLRRGFLAVSAEGNNSLDAVHDYERCLEIALADPTSDEMFSTLIALWGHYVIKGELARADQLSEMLVDVLKGHPDYASDFVAGSGSVRWFAGDFGDAHAKLEEGVAGHLARGTARHYAGTWFMPTDSWASAHLFLALARFVRGVPGVDEQVDAALARCGDLEFPHGSYTAANTLAYRWWIDVERGDHAAARAAVTEIAAAADRHGFDMFVLVAALQGTALDGREALAAGATPDELNALDHTLDGLVATWQMLGIGVFTSFYLGESAALRAAAGDVAGAVARIDEALAVAGRTGMHHYDAELLRRRAGYDAVPRAYGAGDLHAAGDLRAAAPLERALALARRQGATLFERRITGDLAAMTAG